MTKDGVEYYSNNRDGRGETNVTKEKNKDKRKAAYVLWSHDSNKLAIVRADSRKVKDLWVINSIAKGASIAAACPVSRLENRSTSLSKRALISLVDDFF